MLVANGCASRVTTAASCAQLHAAPPSASQRLCARGEGLWPAGFPVDGRSEYSLATIAHWLDRFCARFFGFSQFKRSALPNGPKVSSQGALSPRGDWRAPSDAVATLWREELRDFLPADVVDEVFGDAGS